LQTVTLSSSSGLGAQEQQEGGGGGPGGSNRLRLGHPGAQPSWGIERGDREGLEDVLTTGGDQRGVAGFRWGGRRWGIGGGRSPSTGGAPVLPSRRAGAAEVQLDLAKLLVSAVSPAGLHSRRNRGRPAADLQLRRRTAGQKARRGARDSKAVAGGGLAATK
jgi:hypothetical protein